MKIDETTKVLINGRYETYSVAYSPLYYWIYEYKIGAPLLTSGFVHFQTLGSNAIGWGLSPSLGSSSSYSCSSKAMILDASHQHTSSQIYSNFLQVNRDVYYASLLLGMVLPQQFINQTFQSSTEIIETQISYCDPSSSFSSTEDCVRTPEGSAYIPQNSSIFFINYLLSSKIPDGANASSPIADRSDILIFIPFGESDYSYSEDDVFDEDYREPVLSNWDWLGIALGIITAGLLIVGILFFSRSMQRKSQIKNFTELKTISSPETNHEMAISHEDETVAMDLGTELLAS